MVITCFLTVPQIPFQSILSILNVGSLKSVANVGKF